MGSGTVRKSNSAHLTLRSWTLTQYDAGYYIGARMQAYLGQGGTLPRGVRI
jgi:hypothetical protein